MADQLGRRGHGLTQITGVYRIELIFSPDLSELLAYQHSLAEPLSFGPAGTLTSWSAFLVRRRESALPADVPPIPQGLGDPSRGCRGFSIRPGFEVSTGYFDDPLGVLAELRAQGVLTDAEYHGARTAQLWAHFDEETAAAWRELGLLPAEAVELTKSGNTPQGLSVVWQQTGIPSEEIGDWIGAGLTPEEARDQRSSGLTGDDAKALRSLKNL